MLQKFFAGIIAQVSEEMLMDFFRMILREITLKRKKAELDLTIDRLKAVIDEVSTEGMTDEEKNARLVNAGRDVAARMRDK